MCKFQLKLIITINGEKTKCNYMSYHNEICLLVVERAGFFV